MSTMQATACLISNNTNASHTLLNNLRTVPMPNQKSFRCPAHPSTRVVVVRMLGRMPTRTLFRELLLLLSSGFQWTLLPVVLVLPTRRQHRQRRQFRHRFLPPKESTSNLNRGMKEQWKCRKQKVIEKRKELHNKIQLITTEIGR